MIYLCESDAVNILNIFPRLDRDIFLERYLYIFYVKHCWDMSCIMLRCLHFLLSITHWLVFIRLNINYVCLIDYVRHCRLYSFVCYADDIFDMLWRHQVLKLCVISWDINVFKVRWHHVLLSYCLWKAEFVCDLC
jgi:hypothetical protein